MVNLVREWIALRRLRLGAGLAEKCQPEEWGLALSGGGVRSATFCYGVITALAKSKVFWRFDLMSTVSGGGYIGGMIGRLATPPKTYPPGATPQNAAELQDLLAQDGYQSRQQSWLRANSRYLIPRGSRDWLFAVVTFVRNLIGVHIELGVLCVVIGCLLGLVDLCAWWAFDAYIQSDPARIVERETWWQLVAPWPTLWLLLPVTITLAAITAALYWYLPVGTRPPEEADKIRQKVTETLAVLFAVTAMIFLLGAIDWVGWRLAKKSPDLWLLGGGFAALLALLRSVLPLVQEATKLSLPVFNVAFITDLSGRVLVLVVILLWVSIVHAGLTSEVWLPYDEQVNFPKALKLVGGALLGSLCWMVLTGRSHQFLNRSSLHHFYRARLTRTYLGAANPARAENSRVTNSEALDDIPFGDYAPHHNGAPVHLINVCVNQTYDHNGLFNLDRQGVLMTLAAPNHFVTEKQDWTTLRHEAGQTLGTWMAVSGAAAAPGLGSATRPGWAAMLTTLGVRLGYWWDSYDTSLGSTLSDRLPKYNYLFSELMARFYGRNKRIQFLSDGGHCENTGAYALLAAHCKLIVLADCGADPCYDFNELENLMRRARIDLGIELRFIEPDVSWPADFGTLSDLAKPSSDACLAAAQIRYPGDDHYGVLIVIKPNLTTNLPEDVYNYSRDHPAFPQQSTADQFFSEDQWESYFTLGRHLGSSLTEAVLFKVAGLAAASRPAPGVPSSAVNGASAVEPEKKPLPGRKPDRIIAKKAATVTLSLGAIAASTVGIGAALQNTQPPPPPSDVALLRPLYESYARLSLSPPGAYEPAASATATELMMLWGRNKDGETDFSDNKAMVEIIRTTFGVCKTLQQNSPACRTLLQTFECPPVRYALSPVALNNGYWARQQHTAVASREARAQTLCDGASETVDSDAPPQEVPLQAPAKTVDSHPVLASRGPASVESEPAPPPPPAPSSATSASATIAAARECADIQVFVQIYGPEGRDNVRTLRALWRQAGASVPPIEDVSDTARRQGRSTPSPYARPTVIYHSDKEKACATRLPRLAFQPDNSWTVQPLNSGYKPSPQTIEVWLPPASVAAGFEQWSLQDGYCYQELRSDAGTPVYGVHCHPTAATCISAAGPQSRPGIRQSECVEVNLATNPIPLPLKGWAGSRYNTSSQAFASPMPPLKER